MPRPSVLFGFLPVDRRDRAERRDLARELAGYATDAERNELALLAEAGTPGGAEVSAILGRQAGSELFRTR
jgi:hypothetical protein